MSKEHWFWIVPSATYPFKRRQTTWRMTEEEARKRYGDAAEKVPGSLEVRETGTGGAWAYPNTLGGQKVADRTDSSTAAGDDQASHPEAIPMADDLTNHGARDRSRINVNEDHEVRYWTGTLGVDEATLKQAVKAAGPTVAAVREHLRRKQPNGQ